ncbi:hypothetical protein EON67_09825 [archaeon]|nr:MAG: hypothetical protein EON67_09825 [archaeon]
MSRLLLAASLAAVAACTSAGGIPGVPAEPSPARIAGKRTLVIMADAGVESSHSNLIQTLKRMCSRPCVCVRARPAARTTWACAGLPANLELYPLPRMGGSTTPPRTAVHTRALLQSVVTRSHSPSPPL